MQQAGVNNDLTLEQRQAQAKLRNSLTYYASKALLIQTKEGNFAYLDFNKAQEYLHNEAEKMLEETGMVRIIIVKGRQQGCSTYVTARFLHKAVWRKAKSVFILSHEGTSTETLFQKVERYHENLPDFLKPKVEIANRRQLRFDNGSEYRVGTAGAGSTGRSQTNQYFHGSEVAFYANSNEISSGALQTVADVPGTEIFLESTANGTSGLGAFFYQAAMDALEGKGRYRIVFIPWHWQPEYRTKVPPNAEFSPEEKQLKEVYSLDDEQLYWRQLKIYELKSEWLFRQEYPFTAKEAFQTSGTTLISPIAVQAARKSTVSDTQSPLIMGVDAARSGDRTIILFRRGRQVTQYYSYSEMDEMHLCGLISSYIEKLSVSKAFIDVGSAYGTIDRLHELGYAAVVTAVNFGERAIRDDIYINKRAEMAGDMRDWFEEGNCRIPDDEELEADLLAVPDFKLTSSSKRQLIAKDQIRKTFGKSPDIFDALALTFAYPVRNDAISKRFEKRTVPSKNGSPFRTINRFRQKETNDDAVEWNLWAKL
jgi:hypothetical protein